MAKSQFRVRHGQEEFYRFGNGHLFTPPIQIIASSQTTPSVQARPAHKSRRGVEYPAVEGSQYGVEVVHDLDALQQVAEKQLAL